MALGPSIIAFVVGALVSLATSWVLVTRLARIGERFGLSESILGMVAALAADTPEITASVTALAHHQRTIGAGVILGSNLFNLAALLGLGAVVAGRIDLHRKVVLLGGAVGLWMAAVCLITVSNVASPSVGLVLVLIVLVAYGLLLGARHRTLRRLPLSRKTVTWLAAALDEEQLELVVTNRPQRGRPQDVVTAILALAAVVVASIYMERGASALGTRYALPGVVVGGLILAAVTSLPNAVAAVYFAAKDRGAAAFSTALNSNSLNVVAGLLLPATVIGLNVPSTKTILIASAYLGLTALTLGLAYAQRGLRRSSGWLIILCYTIFVSALVATS